MYSMLFPPHEPWHTLVLYKLEVSAQHEMNVLKFRYITKFSVVNIHIAVIQTRPVLKFFSLMTARLLHTTDCARIQRCRWGQHGMKNGAIWSKTNTLITM